MRRLREFLWRVLGCPVLTLDQQIEQQRKVVQAANEDLNALYARIGHDD